MTTGPKIIADTLTARGRRGAGQPYNSRSDHHSRLTVWAVLFDLLREAQHGPGAPRALWVDARAGKLGFRMNHSINLHGRSKKLDLVVCDVGRSNHDSVVHFVEAAKLLAVELSKEDRRYLDSLRAIPLVEVAPNHVGNARIVIEAKAAMNDLVKAIPRLYAEIVAAGITARDAQLDRHWPHMVFSSVTMVNSARVFQSSTTGGSKINRPGEAASVISMLSNSFTRGLLMKAWKERKSSMLLA